MTATGADIPPQVYIGSEKVMGFLADHGRERVHSLTAARVLAMGMLAGAFITTGAFLSILLSTGVASEGPARLLQGLGFSAGFFFVILSGAVLFTEANVVLPAVVLSRRDRWRPVLRFWALAWVGNLAGAALTGQLIALASHPSPATVDLLSRMVATKTATTGQGPGAWAALVVSGFLANWLVGMAAFFATMGRTLIGKYIPILHPAGRHRLRRGRVPAQSGQYGLLLAASGHRRRRRSRVPAGLESPAARSPSRHS